MLQLRQRLYANRDLQPRDSLTVETINSKSQMNTKPENINKD